MKVLFAVSSESISEAIIKRYQKEYKEILSYKNVYYFNAILKEIQKDKTYDRIVISEDLEPFSNSNYDTIDKFIFEKLDSISDEAHDNQGKEASIILICTDRRVKGSSILVKLFGIGVYNALLGNDRSMDEVCKLINRPRSKKDAKLYYRIDAEDVNYKAENENEVSEVEIQNILAHFKKLGRNTAKYSESFNNISTQYTDEQLRIIVNCLPINVKAVLESECQRYQELMAVTGKIPSVRGMAQGSNIEGVAKNEIRSQNIGQAGNVGGRPIVIPSAVRNARGPGRRQIPTTPRQPVQAKPVAPEPAVEETPIVDEELEDLDIIDEVVETPVAQEPQRPATPERPAAQVATQQQVAQQAAPQSASVQRPVARPVAGTAPQANVAPEQPARPTVTARPVAEPQRPAPQAPALEEKEDELDDLLPGFDADAEEEEIALPGLDDLGVTDEVEEADEEISLPGLDLDESSEDDLDLDLDLDVKDESSSLPGLEEDEEDVQLPGFEDEVEEVEDDVLPGFEEEEEASLPGLDDEEVSLPGLDLEDGNADDLDLDLDLDVEEESSSLPGLDDIEVGDDILTGIDIETNKDIGIPGYDDLGVDVDDGIDDVEEASEEPRRGRGRPRKTPVGGVVLKPKGKRGRPRKVTEEDIVEPEANEQVTLPGLDDLGGGIEDLLDEADDLLPGFEEEAVQDDNTLPGFDDLDATSDVVEESAEEEISLPGFEDEVQEEYEEDITLPGFGEDVVLDENIQVDETVAPEEEALLGLDDLGDLGAEEITLGDDILEEEYVEDELLPEELPGEEIAGDELSLGDDLLQDMGEEEVDLGDGLSEEDYTDEVALPGLDELDDEFALDEDGLGTDELDDLGDLEGLGGDLGADMDQDLDDGLLPGMGMSDPLEEEEESLLPGMGFEDEGDTMIPQRPMGGQRSEDSLESIKPRVDYSMSSLNSLITKDKKIVTFIGTSKNGTSFLVNNLAALFSSLGINTAILDMTKNKNSYFIFTKNEEELRTIAYNSIEKLQNGYAEGVRVDKNLTVYTDVPNSGRDYSNAEPILSTLVQNHSLILIDCDYDTDFTYFASCQEMYLVQSMDILTIQPLTAFMRELKTRGILEPEKIRVVINKELKIHKRVGDKDIIGGLAYYNDPAMSFMTELFNKDTVKAISIPFDITSYARYLGGIVDCELSLNGYSKPFLSKLKLLGDMVYPLTSKQSYSSSARPETTTYNPNAFSNSMNDTLSKMRKKY